LQRRGGTDARRFAQYVNNYTRALQTLSALRSDRKVAEILAAATTDPECSGLELTSFLIMPIQRIPRHVMAVVRRAGWRLECRLADCERACRYRLLLEQLKKYTEKSDADIATLEDGAHG
jgi:hypothetical protein